MKQVDRMEGGEKNFTPTPRTHKKDNYNGLKIILSIAPHYQNLNSDYPITGEKKWVIRKGIPWPERILKDGEYLYVVLPDGEVRITADPRPKSHMHHPELVGGREVIAAGLTRILDRQIVRITNESGHYCPAGDSVTYARAAFKYWSAPLSPDLKLDGTWECH